MKGFIGLLAAAFLAMLMAACGGPSQGPELGDFPAINKGDQDPPFPLTPPSSRSPAAFTFTSSDPAVATIDGATVTIHGVGTSTITASQPGVGSYGPTQKSTTLTVKAGTTPPPTNPTDPTAATCVSPAELKDNRCVVPGIVATVTTVRLDYSTLTWVSTKATKQDTWTNARDFCMNSSIAVQNPSTGNQTGWRLPSVDELATLYNSGALTAANWIRGATWSAVIDSTSTAAAPRHTVVNLGAGVQAQLADSESAYVTCVR
jgi:hypothetical protein